MVSHSAWDYPAQPRERWDLVQDQVTQSPGWFPKCHIQSIFFFSLQLVHTHNVFSKTSCIQLSWKNVFSFTFTKQIGKFYKIKGSGGPDWGTWISRLLRDASSFLYCGTQNTCHETSISTWMWKFIQFQLLSLFRDGEFKFSKEIFWPLPSNVQSKT